MSRKIARRGWHKIERNIEVKIVRKKQGISDFILESICPLRFSKGLEDRFARRRSNGLR